MVVLVMLKHPVGRVRCTYHQHCVATRIIFKSHGVDMHCWPCVVSFIHPSVAPHSKTAWEPDGIWFLLYKLLSFTILLIISVIFHLCCRLVHVSPCCTISSVRILFLSPRKCQVPRVELSSLVSQISIHSFIYLSLNEPRATSMMAQCLASFSSTFIAMHGGSHQKMRWERGKECPASRQRY